MSDSVCVCERVRVFALLNNRWRLVRCRACADIQLDLFSLLPEFDREFCVYYVCKHNVHIIHCACEGVGELEKLGIVQKTMDARRRVLAARERASNLRHSACLRTVATTPTNE